MLTTNAYKRWARPLTFLKIIVTHKVKLWYYLMTINTTTIKNYILTSLILNQ